MPIYLDCNATTPLEPMVYEIVHRYLVEDFGNAGSRTHVFGSRAKQAIQLAREQVAGIVSCRPEEVVFTSGATESDNLAILGLAEWGLQQGKRHIISSGIEHKAVLEPLEELRKRGFEITYLEPGNGGWIRPESIAENLRPDTLLVSLMHINNETGVIQPINEFAKVIETHEAFFHVDAAQSYGKEFEGLRDQRVDLISISGHKIFAPKGVGALITRRRGFKSPPLRPLQFGGGQERGLRPGTLPVHLIAGLGMASELALANVGTRRERCLAFRDKLLQSLSPLGGTINGDLERVASNSINMSFPGISSESAMVVLKDLIAISNGSACTSQSYQPSHVLKAMNLPDDRIRGALRFSWCHLTEDVDWKLVVNALGSLL